jgi:xylitol oxidase
VPGGHALRGLARALAAEGVALANLASLPHISVAGAIATATHGSGDGNGNLAIAVAGLELVMADGEVLAVARGDPDFEGMVVALGALGAVTRVALEVEPAYQVRQRAFEGLAWERLFEHFDEVTSAGYSVSMFTRWGGTVEQVWVKSRVGDAPEQVRGELFGAAAAAEDRHPILGIDPVNCTRQLGVLRPVLQVSELRTVAADRLWMSPQHGRDTLSVHFTWVPDWAAVRRVLVEVEAALAPFGAHPHWGKLFLAEAATVVPLYERAGDFARLAGRLDPRGVFANDWLRRHLLG